MKKVTLNYILDIAAFVAFAFLTTTGVLLEYSLPERSGWHTTIWGLSRHQWGDLHLYIAIGLFSLLALHLVLHWQWLLNVTRGRSDRVAGLRFGIGALSLLVVLALASAPLVAPLETQDRAPAHPWGQGSPERGPAH